MQSCILHVTGQEYDRILQLNHNALVWKNPDREFLRGLEKLLGKDVVDQVARYESCRLQKHDHLDGIARVEAAAELTADELAA
jgi:hypothetical protein